MFAGIIIKPELYPGTWHTARLQTTLARRRLTQTQGDDLGLLRAVEQLRRRRILPLHAVERLLETAFAQIPPHTDRHFDSAGGTRGVEGAGGLGGGGGLGKLIAIMKP